MKKIRCIIISVVLVVCFSFECFATDYGEKKIVAPTVSLKTGSLESLEKKHVAQEIEALIKSSNCSIQAMSDGNIALMLEANTLVKTNGKKEEYVGTNIELIYEGTSSDVVRREIQRIKDNDTIYAEGLTGGNVSIVTGARGTLDDSMWFLGYSLMLQSEIQYQTQKDSKGTWVKIISADYSARVNCGTTISKMSAEYGETGFKMGGGTVSVSKEVRLSSTSGSVTYPSSWPYILWHSTSATGFTLYASVYRQDGVVRNYAFYNYILGTVY